MKKVFRRLMITAVAGTAVVLIDSATANAAGQSVADKGDTAWILLSSALVLLMTPGLAMFYGGMVRRKNVMSVLMQCFAVMAIISVQWVLFGYSLSFAPDIGHVIGGLDWVGLKNVGMEPNPDYAATIPHMAFSMFQLMFAIITAGLITGAIAERMRFLPFVVFVLLWTTMVYDPLAHWVWGVNGWLRSKGALDFAGGTVVHISSGVSGLVAAIMLGRRRSWGCEPILPHNLPMTVLGAGLLWFGWFGFNAGSALTADGLAASAFVTTNTAAAAGALSWTIAEWLKQGKPTTLGLVSGLVAGLVAVTPAAGFITPAASLVFGLAVGPICYYAVSRLKEKLGYDDALDAFGIHGVGGTVGALLTGVFATTQVNPLGANGLLHGNIGQMWLQAEAVIATYAFAAFMTLIILKLINVVTPLRVEEEEEDSGIDLAQHGEEGYHLV